MYLPKGISAETWRRGVQKLIVTSTEHGKPKRLSFPWTLAGLEEAKALNDTYKKEVRKYGADFGNITEDAETVKRRLFNHICPVLGGSLLTLSPRKRLRPF